MVKIYESAYSYDYSFPAVTLAYFLRYPNPYSTHVLSTDTIDAAVDPATGRLSVTRIHHKRSRVPPAVLKLLPASVLGNGGVSRADGSSSSYVLERSEVDVGEGWMRTESRNLDWTGILTVIERQRYERVLGGDQAIGNGGGPSEGQSTGSASLGDIVQAGTTDVLTTVKFRSRMGDKIRARVRGGVSTAATAPAPATTAAAAAAAAAQEAEQQPRRGLLASWSTAGIQRSIEAIASRRTVDQMGRSKDGMTVVLERLRRGGLGGVMDGMRRDREKMGFGGGAGGAEGRFDGVDEVV